MQYNPLVSIVIITYNSSKTIIETLDSIKEQTYNNIELIISDDCSTDDTVALCKKWIIDNSQIKFDTEIVTSDKNTGVATNLNRGIKRSRGDWIKSLAGDDTLTFDSIEMFIRFVSENKCHICISDIKPFCDENIDLDKYQNLYNYYFKTINGDYKKQLNQIIKEYTFPGPGFFYSRFIYDLVGGFDERYPFCEEWPFVYKILKKKFTFYSCPYKLVNYRVLGNSLCHKRDNNQVDYRLYSSIRNFYFDYLHSELIVRGKIFTAWDNYISYKYKDAVYMNHKFNIFLFRILNCLSINRISTIIKRRFTSIK